MLTCFKNARLVKNHALVDEDLWIAGGKIVAQQAKANEVVDVKGLIIAPGYIDLQINGGFGIDLSTEPAKIDQLASQLPNHGVTSFLATLVSLSEEQYKHIIPILNQTKQASMLGIHLEGPFLNVEQRGAHDKIQIPSNDFYGSLKRIKLVTLAPEIPGALQLIASLKQRNIVAALGHSNATYEETESALQAGASLVTHLYNAMAPFHHRNPGLIGAALTKQLFYSIIADGIHVHPAAIDLAWRANPQGLVLITDAMAALGMPDGSYSLGNCAVEVKNKKAMIKGTNTLAGSTLSLDAAVRNLRAFTGCSVVQAIEAASLKPAQVLGIENSKGTLNEGADADFIFLDDQLFVRSCYIAGKCV